MQSGVPAVNLLFCWLPSALPEDPQRTVHTRVAVIPHPVVEEETMDAPWRGLWAQASTDNTLPRSRVTRNDGPKTACAAVAPRQTSNLGLTRRSSASSHGRQAAISREFGF